MLFVDRIATVLLILLAVTVSLAFLSTYAGWPLYLELFSHFQVQYAVFSLILLWILLLLRRKWSIYPALMLCVALSLQPLIWYWGAGSTRGQAADLRILSANVNSHNRQYQRVIDLVRSHHPDIAVFLEVTPDWAEALGALQEEFPYTLDQAESETLDVQLYSRRPLHHKEVRVFGDQSKASLIAQLIVADQPVTVVATHPPPPFKSQFFRARNRQFEAIGQYLSGRRDRTILVGDLNVTMWSPYYRRLVAQSGLHDSRQGFGILPTWPTGHRKLPPYLTPLMRIPIDHCLISEGLRALNITTGSGIGSDHKPIIVDLAVVAFITSSSHE